MALSLRDIVLVGHSAGGRNAFLYTVRHPETVRALVIVDIDPDAANPESASMFRRYHAESDEWGSLDAVIERLRSRQPNSTDEMLAHQARHMTREVARRKARLEARPQARRGLREARPMG